MARTPPRQSAAATERLHLQIDRKWVRALRHEAAERRVSLRALVEACIADHYDPDRQHRAQWEVLKELRGLRQEIRGVSFGNRVLVELSTLTTKNLFACLPAPTPASRSVGEGFYNALIASVEKVFTWDTPLLDRLTATLMRADEPDLDDIAADTSPP